MKIRNVLSADGSATSHIGPELLSPPTLGINLSPSSGHSAPSEVFSSSSIASSSLSLTSTASEVHSISTPSNPQSSNSGLSSLTGSSQPMSHSATSSSAQPSISPKPPHTVDKPVDSPPLDPQPTSMSSGGPSKQPPSVSNTRGNAAPSPTGATTKASTTPPPKPPPPSPSKPPPPPPSTKNNNPGPTAGSTSPPKPPSGSSVSPTKFASTVVTVVPLRPSNTSTIFTTITSSPETTLSLPSSISVTNPLNGKVSLTAPAMVTVLSTSTEPDGAFVTFTHLVANPTGLVNTERTSTGFLENQGQVAGVFTVVGVVATALIVGLVWFIRRHRRRQRRKAWFASLRYNPPSPFGSEGNNMRSVHTTSEIIHEPHMVDYREAGYRPRSPPEESTGLGLTGIGATTEGVIMPLRRPRSGGDPFRDPPHVPQNTPVSHSPYRNRFNEPSGPSIAPSSPSIYPESLPPADELPSTVGPEPKSQIRSQPEPLLRRTLSVPGHGDAPPRPPRSHLRESYKPGDIIPLTPPTSVSSHGQSQPPSPEEYYPGIPEHSVTRRATYNVRPRMSQENPASDGSRGTFGERW